MKTVQCRECGQSCVKRLDQYTELYFWHCPSHGLERYSAKTILDEEILSYSTDEILAAIAKQKRKDG